MCGFMCPEEQGSLVLVVHHACCMLHLSMAASLAIPD
jgi:hypothetical protein